MLWAALDSSLAPAPDAARIGWLSGVEYAHRGLHRAGIPENSLAACEGAIARGMGIECDVQQTRDGQAVVFHDWELDRLTGESGAVGQRSAAELAQTPLHGSNERIPRLSELLALVRGRAPLLIEIKTRRERRIAPLCLAVRRELEGYAGPVAVMSFDPRVGAWFRQHAPRVVRGLVITEEGARTYSASVKRHLSLWRARPDFLAYDVRDLPSPFASAQRKRGLPVVTWTVRSPALRRQATEHADGPIAEGEGVAEAGKVL